MPDTPNPYAGWLQPSYTDPQQYVNDLSKATSAYADIVNAGRPVDDNGNVSGTAYSGYQPTTVAHYTPEQALALWNKMDPALANDPVMLEQLVRAQGYFKEGQFTPGAATATADVLKSAQDQWAVDKAKQDKNSSLFSSLVVAAIALGTGAVLGGATGLIGAEGAGVVPADLGATALGGGEIPASFGYDVAAGSGTIGADAAAATAAAAGGGEIPASFGADTAAGGSGTIGQEAATAAAEVTPDTTAGNVLTKAQLDGTTAFGANSVPGAANLSAVAPPYTTAAADSQAASQDLGLTPADTSGQVAGPVDIGTPAVPGATTTTPTGTLPKVPGVPTPGASSTTPTNLLGSVDNAQLLATLGSLFSGNNTANAISSAADQLTQGITDSKGQLLTSKTEALTALANGLLDQKAALAAGLVDANGALTKSSQDALAAVTGGAASAKGDLTSALSPYTDAGKAALQRLTAGTAPGGEFNSTFTMADAQNTPAMQFAQDQGQSIIQNSAAAKGGLLGSNTLAGLTQFGQANAAQYENQAFNQWLANRNANMAPIEAMANNGQNAATALGTGLANIDTGLGTAQANIDQATGQRISSNDMTTAGNLSGAIGNNSTNVANIATGYGRDIAGLDQTAAQILANSTIGQANAQSTGVQNAISAYGALAGTGSGTGSGAASGNSLAGQVWNAAKGIFETAPTGGVTDLTGVPADTVAPPVDSTAIDLFGGY